MAIDYPLQAPLPTAPPKILAASTQALPRGRAPWLRYAIEHVEPALQQEYRA